MTKEIRVPTQVHTRKLDRAVAHTNMKNGGSSRVNKGKKYRKVQGGQRYSTSYFASNWRDYVGE